MTPPDDENLAAPTDDQVAPPFSLSLLRAVTPPTAASPQQHVPDGVPTPLPGMDDGAPTLRRRRFLRRRPTLHEPLVFAPPPTASPTTREAFFPIADQTVDGVPARAPGARTAPIWQRSFQLIVLCVLLGVVLAAGILVIRGALPPNHHVGAVATKTIPTATSTPLPTPSPTATLVPTMTPVPTIISIAAVGFPEPTIAIRSSNGAYGFYAPQGTGFDEQHCASTIGTCALATWTDGAKFIILPPNPQASTDYNANLATYITSIYTGFGRPAPQLTGAVKNSYPYQAGGTLTCIEGAGYGCAIDHAGEIYYIFGITSNANALNDYTDFWSMVRASFTLFR